MKLFRIDFRKTGAAKPWPQSRSVWPRRPWRSTAPACARGLLRVEVLASKADALLLRAVAAALADPVRAGPARTLLRTRIVAPPATSLKALLEAAPLEGVDLERSQDLGRPIEF